MLVSVRNHELEQDIIARGADDDLLLVYGDWLQSHGVPRGELVALQAARRDRPHDEALKQGETELLKSLRAELVGELAGLQEAAPDALTLSWRLGFIDTVRVQLDELPEPWPISRVFRALADLPSAFAYRHLQLEIHFPGAGVFDARLREIPVGVAAPLQQLSLVAPDYLATDPIGSMDFVLTLFPEVRSFELVGTWNTCEPRRDLDALALVSPTLRAEHLSWITQGKAGRLQELRLLRTNVNRRLEEQRNQLVEAFRTLAYSDMGRLQRVGVGIADRDDMDRVVSMLLESPLPSKIDTWFLPLRFLSDDARSTIAAHADRVRNVRFEDLGAATGAWEKWQITTLLRELDRTGEALAFATSALEEYDDHHHLCSEVGHLLRDLDRHADAVAAYERALAVDPECWACHYNQAWSLRDLHAKDHFVKDAAAALEKVELAERFRRSDEPAPLLWFLRGQLLIELGQAHEGRECLERTIAHYTTRLRRSRKDVNARYWRAAAWALAGQKRKAMREVRKIVKLDPAMREFDWDWCFTACLGDAFRNLLS